MSMVERQSQATLYHPESEERKANFELIQREATALSKSSWIPKHLVGKTNEETVATCVGLAQMAEKWNMSTQMVAGETYSVHGRIGFQGKLYAALANAHGGLVGGLRAIYSGSGDNRAAVIFGGDHELTSEDKQALKKYVKTGDADAATDLELSGVRCVRIVVSNVKTDNAMWKNDPEQKLYYTGATKWCRRFMSELVLGAISVEDIERQQYEDFGGNKADRARAMVAARREQAALPSPVVEEFSERDVEPSEDEPQVENRQATRAQAAIALANKATSLEELDRLEKAVKQELTGEHAESVLKATKARAAELAK